MGRSWRSAAYNFEDLGALAGRHLHHHLDFIDRSPDLESGVGRLICRRMGIKPSHEQPPLFIPERCSEQPVAKYGKTLVTSDAFDESHVPRICLLFVAKAEVLVEPDPDMTVRRYEIKKDPGIIGDCEFAARKNNTSVFEISLLCV